MADTSYTRRLPVYLVIDCSGSMSGEPIEAVRQGIKALLSDLRGDPQALETAYLSVITFDSTARQVMPLTDLMSFKEPEINANGATAMGAALRLLISCMKTELRQSTPTQKGDWRPLVFLFTDGKPTDENEMRAAAAELSAKKPANIIACAAGPAADSTLLKQITESVLEMNNITPKAMAAFFAWVSSSIKTTSKSLDAAPGAAVGTPPPPQGFNIVP